MENINKVLYTAFIFFSLPLVMKAQEKNNSMAILENKKEVQRILSYNHLKERQKDSILVLYNNKLYSLKDFDLTNTIYENGSLNIINERDSIARMILKNVKSLIVIEKGSKEKK